MTEQTFDHVLHLLPPVADGPDTLWFVYLDQPDKWRNVRPRPGEVLDLAQQLLRRLLEHERRPDPRGRTPNATVGGPIRPLPNLKPRWSVHITADPREEQPEWTIELLDDSAWASNDYDLRTLMAKLAHRIAEANVPVQPLMASRPAPAVTPPAKEEGFEAQVYAALTSIRGAISRKESQVSEAREQLAALRSEERALHAALAAYRKQVGKKVVRSKRTGLQPAEVSA